MVENKGPLEVRYENGEIAEKGAYEQGLLQGDYETFHRNQQRASLKHISQRDVTWTSSRMG